MAKAKTLQELEARNPKYANNKVATFGKETSLHKEHTVNEIREFSTKQQYLLDKFAAVNAALQISDLTKTETRTYTTFSKETLRTYMKNPKANEDNLRALSQFLYRMCFPYRRIIQYYANMIDLNSYTIMPTFDYKKTNNTDQSLKQYYETAKMMEVMNLPLQLMQLLIIAWREDAAFGYIYAQDDDFFILPMDGKYCRISSINPDGTLNYAWDFSYFRSNPKYLEYWDKEFETKYNAFIKDPNLRWQELDPNKTICLKVNFDDKTLILSPFANCFEAIIDLIDLQSVQAVNDELATYKLLVAELDTFNNSDTPDDFKVDLDTAIEFYNRLAESLPAGVSSAISPLKITPVSFKDDQTEEVNRVSSSMSNLFKNVGVTQILDSTRISGSTAFEASILADTLTATRVLLPQIEAWCNRYLTTVISKPAEVKFIEVTPYTKAKKINELKDAATLGIPVKLPLAVLQGFTPLEIASMQSIEEGLGVFTEWKPMQSSYTSNIDGDPTDKGGRPEIDTDAGEEISSEGEASRDGDKGDKG